VLRKIGTIGIRSVAIKGLFIDLLLTERTKAYSRPSGLSAMRCILFDRGMGPGYLVVHAGLRVCRGNFIETLSRSNEALTISNVVDIIITIITAVIMHILCHHDG
jgi:hypothetical protein